MPRFVIYPNSQYSSQDLRSRVENVLTEYTHSLLVNATDDQIQAIKQLGIRVRELFIDPGVRVNSYLLNTSMSSSRLETARALSAGPALSATQPWQYVIVQLVGPIHPNWMSELESLGMKKYTSFKHYAHLIRIPTSRLSELKAKDYVESVSDYVPQLKVAEKLMNPEVHNAFPATEALAFVGGLAEPIEPNLSDREFNSAPHNGRTQLPPPVANIQVILFEEDDSERVIEQLQAMNLSIDRVAGKSLTLTARPEDIPQIASISEIFNIEPNSERVLHNLVATGVIKADVLQNDFGLDGAGQIVAVADTGLDTGEETTVSDDFKDRIIALQDFGRPGKTDDPDGHGTHVAGSVLGNGSNSNGNIRGIAPSAELVFQSVLDSNDGLGGLNDLENVFQQAFNAGARIHNNSWGYGNSDGRYNLDSFISDEFAFEQRNFLIVFSAGNDAPNFRISAPATAKNVLTVGASESLQPLPANVNFPPSPTLPNGISIDFVDEANNLSDIADFSCRGPAEVNRIKPDIVAPGSWILSARSTVMVADTGPDGLPRTGDEDGVPTHDEAVGLGLPGKPILFAGSKNTPPLPGGSGVGAEELYMYQSGTSMAAPITAGCCALIRQHVMKLGHDPSAALIKALIVNGAVNIRTTVPANDQGWGRVDLSESIQSGGNPIQFDDDIDHSVGSLDIRIFRARVADPSKPMTVTLVWRDPPGREIQNELHLQVFDGDSSAARFSDSANDILNNVQKVIIDRLSSDFVRIEVEGDNITRGIPERPGDLVQDFALVVGNATSLNLSEDEPQSPQELTVDGLEIMGEIDPAGESDIYVFNVTTAGAYTIETSGSTDTFLSLFGPNSNTNLITQDDDSGPGFLSSIQQSLAIGTYFVRVRLYDSARTGAYGVRVRRG
ncbi:MAG: S8 family serine peptidase [Cyanobacteria bacterium P01_B01_bin.77]